MGYAFGDELNATGEDLTTSQEYIGAGGLLSKIVGTKKSRKAAISKVPVVKLASKIVGTKKSRQAAISKVPVVKLASKIVGTEKSRGIVKEKVKSAVKTVGLAPSRAALLGILAINGFGLASDLNKEKKAKSAKWDKMRNEKWPKWGGNRTQLDKTVENGAKRKALKLSLKKNKGASGIDSYELVYDPKQAQKNGMDTYKNVAGETVAMITAAAPILVAVFSLLGKKQDANLDAETEAALAAEAATQSAEMTAAQAEQDEINAITPESERLDAIDSSISKWLWIGGGILVTGILLWIIFKPKK
jgi:hypothetical protein